MTKQLSPSDLAAITTRTLHHYDSHVESFWEGTKDHDVTQNLSALLGALPKKKGLRILDFGCGPGRDLRYLKNLGHEAVGLDGCAQFCAKAKEYSGCQVLNQNFLQLALPKDSFDGIFANASLFHIPYQELVRVLRELHQSLISNGILFSSNPRGSGEGWSGDRYGAYFEWAEYQKVLSEANFEPIDHYYRPPGLARENQTWLAVLSRKLDAKP